MATIHEALSYALNCQLAGRLQEAATICQQILAAEPNNVDAWHLLGVVACQMGDHQRAVQLIHQALQLRPNQPRVLNSLGIALRETGNLDEAVASFRQAIRLDPLQPVFHYNLASGLHAQDSLEEAADCYRHAAALQPESAETHNNLGLVLNELGDIDEAESCFRRAVALNPESVEAHLNLSTVLLLRGNYDLGWAEFEWRLKGSYVPPRDFGRPRWDGGDIRGKTILLFADAGIGDTLQFVRYTSVVQALGTKVLFEDRARMIPLLSSCPGIDRLVARGGELLPFEVSSPLQGLLRQFLKSEETIPRQVPYLFADPLLVARWGNTLSAVTGFRIGINWRGREGQGKFRRRDIPLELFCSLAAIPGVNLINLHKGEGRRELAEARGHVSIFDPGEQVDTASGAFMDTAAIMKNLDLVVTSDTAIAHLAGALGMPVWVALPFVPDWRWLLERSDSPWYPTMRLFRQKKRGDWAGVFEEIRAALTELVQGSRFEVQS